MCALLKNNNHRSCIAQCQLVIFNMDMCGMDTFDISACGKGTYGLNCNTSCNNCLSETCDNVEGLCTIKDTCKPGYLGSKCDQGIL